MIDGPIGRDISFERLRQKVELNYDAASDDAKTHNDWIALLARHVGMAANDTVMPFDPVQYRKQLVRVAAIAVAALESFDRKSQPKEKVFGRPEGSGF